MYLYTLVDEHVKRIGVILIFLKSLIENELVFLLQKIQISKILFYFTSIFMVTRVVDVVQGKVKYQQIKYNVW